MSDNKQPFNDRSDAHLISRVCVVELHSFIIEEIFWIATDNNKNNCYFTRLSRIKLGP